METILRLTARLLTPDLVPDGYETFIEQVNQDIQNLNKLISLYNNHSEIQQKQTVLRRIEDLYDRILNKYPNNLLAASADFLEKIQHKLYYDIQIERKNCDIASPDLESFEYLLMTMSTEKLEELAAILNQGPDFNPELLENLYSPLEPGYEEFNRFMDRMPHFAFLDGNNSKNFEINYPDSHSEVLTLENRLDFPCVITSKMRSNLSDLIPEVRAKRAVTFEDDTSGVINRSVVLNDYCVGRDLELHTRGLSQDKKIEYALILYAQMAKSVLRLQDNQLIFPDMKNANWLLNDKGQLVILDTKSFLYMNHKGKIDTTLPENQWHNGFIQDHGVMAYEIAQRLNHREPIDGIDVDKLHSFAMGKNIFQYLTECTNEELATNTLPFEGKAIFQTPQGIALRTLIESMTSNDIKTRPSIKSVLMTLNEIQMQFRNHDVEEKKTECRSLLRKINELQLFAQDPQITQFINTNASKIDSANRVSELKEIQSLLNKIITENTSSKALKTFLSYQGRGIVNTLSAEQFNTMQRLLSTISLEERSQINKKNAISPAVIQVQTMLKQIAPKKWLAEFYLPSEKFKETIKNYREDAESQSTAFLAQHPGLKK